MPNWLKVLLIVGGLLLVLFVAAVGALVYLGMKHGPALVEAGKHSVEEGREYGRRTDESGCLNEAVARHKRADGLTAIFGNSLFLRSCLDVSSPTPHFCDDVPYQAEFLKGARWQSDECKRYGLTPEQQCGQLFQQVQQYCDQLGRKGVKTPVNTSPEEQTGEDTDEDDSEPPPEPPPPPKPPPPPRSK